MRDDGGVGRIRPSVALVLSVGLALTGAATAATEAAHRHSERRLLQTQTRQAGAVIGAQVLRISSPLTSAVQLARATRGDVSEFRSFMAEHTGPGKLFVAASLWGAGGRAQLASLGVAPVISPARRDGLLALATRTPTFVVEKVETDPAPRIAYAYADPEDPTYVVFAERAIPANRQVPVEKDSAFASLHFATYVGRSTRAEDLATTDLPPGDLPLTGSTARTEIPFGNSRITLVTSPMRDLGGSFGGRLPWICLGLGLLLTAVMGLATSSLVRRRRAAERDGATIRALYERLDGLYDEQRTIATTLQHALLPTTVAVPGVDVACRYVAGAEGVDVGGDWYSLVELDEGRFAFAVGDVSGRGVEAAAVMARLQFTMGAYLQEGHPPEAVLGMCARQVDLLADGHFATALVGVCDRGARRVTVASAGHPAPLVVGPSGSAFVPLSPGVPLGVGSDTYTAHTIELPATATLVAFTDGLVERRGESIEDGLARLAAVPGPGSRSTGEWLDALLVALGHEEPADDIAVLAFSWVEAASDLEEVPPQPWGKVDSPTRGGAAR